MPTRRLIVFVILAGLLLACNFPLFAPAEPSPTPTTAAPTGTNTAVALSPTATLTPAPLASATPTVIPTPSTPQVTPNSVNVNCRSGPDVGYDSVGVLMFGATTGVAGRNKDSSWWFVDDPSNPGGFCWISADVVTISGPIAGIPFKAPPPPIVTKVTVDVNLPSSVSCGGPNPVSFSGTITTNGSLTAKYQWEITGDKTNTTAPETLDFSDAGTQDVPDPGSLSFDCGNYKIALHILSPNNISASKKFKIAP
jgi:hypothetical protein